MGMTAKNLPQKSGLEVRKELLLEKPLPQVFEFFVDFGRWWPMLSHSLGRETSGGVCFPPEAGLAITERLADRSQALWGKVLAFERPSKLVFTWHPGRPATEATEVEISFRAEGEGKTRVLLVHRGWEILAGEPVNWRQEYDKGWEFVLCECFAGHCQKL
jgi:uncharacterized protein YndB with AHSA1/START domain